MPAFAFELQHGVDHVFEDSWSRDRAILCDMADQGQREALFLGQPDQLLRAGAHLRDRARRTLQTLKPEGLNGIDDDEVERSGLFKSGQNLPHGRRGGEGDGGG